MFLQDTSIQCQGSIYMHNAMFSCSAITPIFLGSGLHQKAVPLVWSQGLQPQRDGASCLGFLIMQQRQCWQRLLGFPSLNVTFSSACLLQTLLKDNTVCGCLSACSRMCLQCCLPSIWTPLLSGKAPTRMKCTEMTKKELLTVAFYRLWAIYLPEFCLVR